MIDIKKYPAKDYSPTWSPLRNPDFVYQAPDPADLNYDPTLNPNWGGRIVREAWARGAYDNRVTAGRPKGAKDLTPRKQRTQRKVTHGDKVFDNAFIAAEVYGIHPVNMRRRCRLEIMGFKYA
jgi:hypothetical protein